MHSYREDALVHADENQALYHAEPPKVTPVEFEELDDVERDKYADFEWDKYDWEGWLEVRFPYPSPADFHNFRLGIAYGAIVIVLRRGRKAKPNEKLSKPWREAVLAYIIERGADPLKVSDALWLYSLVMCGNSPATVTREPAKQKVDKQGNKIKTLFTHAKVQEDWDHNGWALRKTKRLKETCLACPFLKTCKPVPSKPYYRNGQLIIRDSLGLEPVFTLDSVQFDPKEVSIDPEVQHILELADLDVAA